MPGGVWNAPWSVFTSLVAVSLVWSLVESGILKMFGVVEGEEITGLDEQMESLSDSLSRIATSPRHNYTSLNAYE